MVLELVEAVAHGVCRRHPEGDVAGDPQPVPVRSSATIPGTSLGSSEL